MGALNSIPLCARTREVGQGENEADRNNNLPDEVDNNLVRPTVVVQPEATSTPKVNNERRRIEPLPEERDLGDSSNSDSLESDLQPSAVSDHTFGSDSGLEQSGDELEITREIEAAEEDKESDDELNVAVDNELEYETPASLESGDLGVDRTTTFRVPPTSEVSMNNNEKDANVASEKVQSHPEDTISQKLEDLESTQAISNMLSDLTMGANTRGVALER